MVSAIAAAAGWLLVLTICTPVLVLARLVVACAFLPHAARGAARLILLTAAYIATLEIPALLSLCRSTGVPRERPPEALARLTARFYGPGMAFAAMRLSCRRPPPAIDGPAIVLARHAGVFNSPLVLHVIASQLGRAPQTIAKRSSAPTPGMRRLYRAHGVVFFDFTGSGRVAALLHLKRLAHCARRTDGIMIFPEGANYTAIRRRRGIESLNADGTPALAEQAARLHHLMHPHPGGARLLTTSVPAADVLIFAHTGLEDLLAWSGKIDYPATATGTVYTAWWHIPGAHVPHDPAAFQDWLGERWREVDRWIAEVREEGIPAWT